MKSKRNKTITVTKEDMAISPTLKLKTKLKKLSPQNTNQIFFGNALQDMSKLPNDLVDLIVTDPPYTIRKDFGKGTVTTKEKEFITWCENWIEQCFRILKPNGSIYICINWG